MLCASIFHYGRTRSPRPRSTSPRAGIAVRESRERRRRRSSSSDSARLPGAGVSRCSPARADARRRVLSRPRSCAVAAPRSSTSVDRRAMAPRPLRLGPALGAPARSREHPRFLTASVTGTADASTSRGGAARAIRPGALPEVDAGDARVGPGAPRFHRQRDRRRAGGPGRGASPCRAERTRGPRGRPLRVLHARASPTIRRACFVSRAIARGWLRAGASVRPGCWSGARGRRARQLCGARLGASCDSTLAEADRCARSPSRALGSGRRSPSALRRASSPRRALSSCRADGRADPLLLALPVRLRAAKLRAPGADGASSFAAGEREAVRAAARADELLAAHRGRDASLGARTGSRWARRAARECGRRSAGADVAPAKRRALADRLSAVALTIGGAGPDRRGRSDGPHDWRAPGARARAAPRRGLAARAARRELAGRAGVTVSAPATACSTRCGAHASSTPTRGSGNLSTLAGEGHEFGRPAARASAQRARPRSASRGRTGARNAHQRRHGAGRVPPPADGHATTMHQVGVMVLAADCLPSHSPATTPSRWSMLAGEASRRASLRPACAPCASSRGPVERARRTRCRRLLLRGGCRRSSKPSARRRRDRHDRPAGVSRTDGSRRRASPPCVTSAAARSATHVISRTAAKGWSPAARPRSHG